MLKLKLKQIADNVNEKNGYHPLDIEIVYKLCTVEAEQGKYSLGIIGKKPFNPLTLKKLREDGFDVIVSEQHKPGTPDNFKTYNLTINWIN